jgi:hydroxyacylglutathione hydrolase
MKQLAEDVYLLRGFPPNFINAYLVGDVLIDAATRQGERRIMRQIAGRTVTAHAPDSCPPRSPGRKPRNLRTARNPAVVRSR